MKGSVGEATPLLVHPSSASGLNAKKPIRDLIVICLGFFLIFVAFRYSSFYLLFSFIISFASENEKNQHLILLFSFYFYFYCYFCSTTQNLVSSLIPGKLGTVTLALLYVAFCFSSLFIRYLTSLTTTLSITRSAL
jgi:hypothetical protein